MSSTTSTAQSLGIVDITWGNTKLQVDAKSSSFSRGGQVYDPVVAGRSVTQAASYVAPTVKASFPLVNGMSLNDLTALNGQQLVVKCDSGQTYTMNGAFFTKDQTVKGGSGNNVSGSWSGQPMLEVVS